ncbi:MAG: ATP-binding protein [Lysobacter sp.]
MSLRARLLIIIGAALGVLWISAAVWMMRDLDRNMQRTLDGRLAMSARMVSGLLAQSSLGAGSSSISARGSLMVPGSDGIACQIRSLRGEIIATTRSPEEGPLQSAVPGFRTVSVDGEQWRTFTLRADGFDITTADRLDERALLRRRIGLAAGIPFLIAAVGGLGALWFGVGRALSPLRELRESLADRRPDEAEPLHVEGLPTELRPLIGSLNQLFARIEQALQRERNFTSDAAHELRTPLTAIDTHLQVARLTGGDVAVQALSDAATGTARMRDTLDQLLLLARVEGGSGLDDGERISARDVVERAVAAAGGDPLQRVRISGDAGALVVDVPAALAVVAVRNLIDNALKYSDAAVLVEVEGGVGRVIFNVRDRGPGLSDDELASAMNRFWRVRKGGKGVGLGLTLVQAVVTAFSGSLELRRRDEGGLEGCLALPAIVH